MRDEPKHLGESVWTEPNLALLREMWGEGRPASHIARLIGTTRNAVIGKARRLKLVHPPRVYRTPEEKKAARAARARLLTGSRIRPPRRVAAKAKRRTAPSFTPRSMPDEPTPIVHSLLALKPHACRWPHGDHGAHTMFCGAPTLELLPYCEYHARVAYTNLDSLLGKADPPPAAARSTG